MPRGRDGLGVCAARGYGGTACRPGDCRGTFPGHGKWGAGSLFRRVPCLRIWLRPAGASHRYVLSASSWLGRAPTARGIAWPYTGFGKRSAGRRPRREVSIVNGTPVIGGSASSTRGRPLVAASWCSSVGNPTSIGSSWRGTHSPTRTSRSSLMLTRPVGGPHACPPLGGLPWRDEAGVLPDGRPPGPSAPPVRAPRGATNVTRSSGGLTPACGSVSSRLPDFGDEAFGGRGLAFSVGPRGLQFEVRPAV
jgi:hypothetical protein